MHLLDRKREALAGQNLVDPIRGLSGNLDDHRPGMHECLRHAFEYHDLAAIDVDQHHVRPFDDGGNDEIIYALGSDDLAVCSGDIAGQGVALSEAGCIAGSGPMGPEGAVACAVRCRNRQADDIGKVATYFLNSPKVALDVL